MFKKILVVVESHVKPPLVFCSFVHFKILLYVLNFVKKKKKKEHVVCKNIVYRNKGAEKNRYFDSVRIYF